MTAREFVETFWLEHFNGRDMAALMERLDPGYRLHDHRLMSLWGGSSTREEWRTLVESWWEMSDDVAVADLDVLDSDREHVLYRVRFAGTDRISGGPLEVMVFAVNRVRDGRSLVADLFDDEDAARALFAERHRTQEDASP